MHLVDLEFSETLELNHRISGGFSYFQDTPIDLNKDIDIDVDIDFYPDWYNPNGSVGPVVFPEEISIEDLVFSPVVGDQIVETPGSIVDNPSVSQPLCL